MHIICVTKQAASQVLLLLMTANLGPIQICGLSPEESLSPPYTITLPQSLDAALRTQIEQIPDTQVVD